MNGDSYGIVVEGDYDVGTYEELIRKICGRGVQIESRVAYGRVRLVRKVLGHLKSLEHSSIVGGPVDKALVVRDANGRNPAEVEGEIRARIGNRAFPFPGGIGVHAVRQEMETWLLADLAAIDKVALARNVRDRVRPIRGSLEDMQHPSQKFEEVLSQAGLNYTAQVCREIAREIDLAVLGDRCPSFCEFERKVLDP